MKIKSYLVELIGTFFLVLTVCVAAVFGTAGVMAMLAAYIATQLVAGLVAAVAFKALASDPG